MSTIGCFLDAELGAEAENPLDDAGLCPIAEGLYRCRFAGWRCALTGRAGLIFTDVFVGALAAGACISNTRWRIALDRFLS